RGPLREMRRPSGPRVHAVPLAGRLRTVGEHVAQMAAAFRAVDLDARHAVTPIDVRGNRVSDRGPESGPAGGTLQHRVVSEERLPAGGAVEGAGPLLVVERTRPRPLG